jgi:hypothetical protein
MTSLKKEWAFLKLKKASRLKKASYSLEDAALIL